MKPDRVNIPCSIALVLMSVFFVLGAILVGCNASSTAVKEVKPSTSIDSVKASPAASESVIPEMNLKFATSQGPTGPLSEAYTYFFQELERRTGGKVKVKLFWSQSLLKATDMVQGVSSGVAEFGSSAANVAPQAIHWNALDLPGNGGDPWAGIWASSRMYKENPQLKKELADLNLVATTGYFSGKGTIQSRMPLVTLEDMKGKRMRAYSGTLVAVQKSLGLVPTQIGFAEMYEALDKGVVDAVGVGWQYVRPLKLWEVVKHVTDTPDEAETLSISATMLVNKKTWDSFPQVVRDLIDELTAEFNNRYARSLMQEFDEGRKEFEAYGGKVYQMDSRAAAAMIEGAKTAREDWFKNTDAKGVNARATNEHYMKLLRELEKEVKEKGYPWNR